MDEARSCQICGGPWFRRDWCAKHYSRWLRHGDPLITLRGDGGVRGFEARVDKTGGPDACHPWQGCTDDHGYGVVQFEGRLQRGHQVAWQITNGPIPPGTELDHECHNRAVAVGQCQPGPCPHRACCNERHIKPKTRAQHVEDTPRRANHPRGEAHGRSILTAQTVREIRDLLTAGELTHREIAEKFGAARSTVHSIKSGRSWSWLR